LLNTKNLFTINPSMPKTIASISIDMFSHRWFNFIICLWWCRRWIKGFLLVNITNI